MHKHRNTAKPKNAQTLWFKGALLPNGWAKDVTITLSGGLIEKVETGTPATHAQVQPGIALPGLVNLHSHGFQRAMSGLTEYRQSGDDDFWSWRELLYKFVDRCTPEDVEAITAMAYAEMLEGGFTRVAEFHYLHHDMAGHAYADPGEMAGRIAAAAGETGIGLTLLPVLYAHSGFGGLEASAGQRRFLNTPASYHDILTSAEAHCAALPDAIVGTAPHSLRAVTPEELNDLSAMRPGRPVHIHIAEQEKEVSDCLAWSGARPVDWLLDHAGVDERWCLVHATHTTPGELQRIANSGAVVGLCPVTEANLGDGIFKAPEFLAAGGHFGVGSDSNVSICAADELRMLEYSQRLSSRRRNVIAETAASTGRTLFEKALEGGNRAGGVTGGLVAGAPADIVVLSDAFQTFSMKSADHVLDAWVFRRGRSAISQVWRRGHLLVENGVHTGRASIDARFQEALDRILA